MMVGMLWEKINQMKLARLREEIMEMQCGCCGWWGCHGD